MDIPPLSHPEVKAILDTLYVNVDGYSISRVDRIGPLEEEKSCIYGEMLLESFAKLMDLAAPQPGEAFYDLGSGTGKALMMAHLLYPFATAVGVELLPSLYTQSTCTQMQYDYEVRPKLAAPRGEIVYRNGNILDEDLSMADVIFTHCTCFSDQLVDQMLQRLQMCKPGMRIVAPSGLFYVPWLERTHEMEYATAWDTIATCYVYRKV